MGNLCNSWSRQQSEKNVGVMKPDMDIKTLTNNQGFLHITEKIFLLLDKKSILDCGMMKPTWKNIFSVGL